MKTKLVKLISLLWLILALSSQPTSSIFTDSDSLASNQVTAGYWHGSNRLACSFNLSAQIKNNYLIYNLDNLCYPQDLNYQITYTSNGLEKEIVGRILSQSSQIYLGSCSQSDCTPDKLTKPLTLNILGPNLNLSFQVDPD